MTQMSGFHGKCELYPGCQSTECECYMSQVLQEHNPKKSNSKVSKIKDFKKILKKHRNENR